MKKVAHLITDIFQSTPSHKVRMLKKFPGLKKDVSPVWLLAPLVSKLPDHLHLKIHNNATLLLDTGSKFGDEKIENNGGQHQPFLNLILACIEKHSLERKSLMEKLVEQVQQFIDDNKDKARVSKRRLWPLGGTSSDPTYDFDHGLGFYGFRLSRVKILDKVHTMASDKMQNLIENIQLRLSLLGKTHNNFMKILSKYFNIFRWHV